MNKAEKQQEQEKNSLIETKWIYQGRIVQLKLDTYQFNGHTKVAEIVHHPGAVVIVALKKGSILFVRQWRRATKEILLELPAGTLEKNENPLDCAKRELQEETGFAAKKITSLGGFYSTPGFCDEYLHIFLAEDLISSPLLPDDDEMIDLVSLSVKEIKKLIHENQIRDAKTIAGFYKYISKINRKK